MHAWEVLTVVLITVPGRIVQVATKEVLSHELRGIMQLDKAVVEQGLVIPLQRCAVREGKLRMHAECPFSTPPDI